MTGHRLLTFVLSLTWSLSAGAATKSESYSGIAKDKKGNVIYTETHLVQYNDKNDVLKAETEYKNPKGELIATLKSDFTKSLTSPEHTYNDLRNGHTHGIRFENDQLVLFKKDKDKPEEVKPLKMEKQTGLAVGCQGLHYYLRDNFSSVNAKKEVPILLLTPGNLGYYNFELDFVGEQNGLYKYEIAITNWFLKLFAPKLEITYDKEKRRLMTYSGLTHVTDEKGDPQNVSIQFQYP